MSNSDNELWLDLISARISGTVYFLGGSDTGKTSLVKQLANRMIRKKPSILDADIGQSGILPLTISLLRADRRFEALNELPLVDQDFIPGYNMLKYKERNAAIMGKMAEQARQTARLCLIDTTGFVTGPGIAVKRLEIEAVRPDLIVALQQSDELRPVLKTADCPCMVVPVPPGMGKKSVLQRKKTRNRKFADYFARGSFLELPHVYAGPAPRSPQNRIIGLYGDAFLGLGLVRDSTRSSLLVLTPVSAQVRRAEFSTVVFNPAGFLG